MYTVNHTELTVTHNKCSTLESAGADKAFTNHQYLSLYTMKAVLMAV